jgi:hypothetical protein
VEAPFKLLYFGPHDPGFAEAEALERHVFDRAFGNSAEVMEAEYRPYDPVSTFVAVENRITGEIIGEAHIAEALPGTATGFKSLDDLRKKPWRQDPLEVLRRSGIDFDPQRTIDVLTIGIAEGYRAQDNRDNDSGIEDTVSMALLHGCIRYMGEHGKKHMVTILDDRVLPKFDLFDKPFKPYVGVGSGSYLDSPSSTPVFMDFEASEKHVREWNRGLRDLMVDGTGLETMVELPPRHLDESGGITAA